MIRRGPRPADRFAMIANAALEDDRLTWRARGVLAYLLSRPEGWSTSAERLAAQSPKGKEGRDAMRTVLAELEAAGYLLREKVQDARGRWSTGMVVYDSPAKNTPEPPIVDTGGILMIPDEMAFAMDDGSADEMVAEAAKIMAQPLVLESAKNGGSPGVGKPAVGQPAVGKPGPISKKETKTDNKKDSSSPTTTETPTQKLLQWPGVEYLKIAGSRWRYLTPEKTWELTQKYAEEVRSRGWRYSEDGWLKFMEMEHEARERRTRGRAYSPDGVPL